MLDANEVLEERSVAHLDIHVDTPYGTSKVTHVCKTIPMTVWVVKTTSFTLRCAHKHIVLLSNNEQVHANTVRPGDMLSTANGCEAVTESYDTFKEESLYDVRIADKTHLYYVSGIASHNSTGLGARALGMANMINRYKGLYIAPHGEQVKTFADRLREMERGSLVGPDSVGGPNSRNNLLFKEYEATGSTIKMQHVLTDPTAIRGNTATELLLDETQNFDASLEPELDMVLKAAKRPVRIYTGTSTTPESMLETKYQESSRGVWMIKSPGTTNTWFSLNDPSILDKIISVDGLRCPNTGKLVNPMKGEFVHEDRQQESIGNVGFHTPQIIVPEYAQGDKWLEIYTDFKKFDRSKFLMEVMGIPVESGQREIDEGDLKKMCMDVSLEQMQAEILTGKRRYRYIISGCDWGGSDYNTALKTKLSYTVHIMLGITGNGDCEIFHYHRYAGMDYQDVGGKIVADHLKYKAFAIGSDFGMGMYYNNYIQQSGRIPYEKHFVWNYTSGSALMAPIKSEGAFLNHLSYHKTESLSALFADIKRDGGPRIRTGNWADTRTFLMDFLNSYRTISDTGSGNVRYLRHGSKADDVLHAVNFAMGVVRVVLNEPMIENKMLVERLRNSMGISNGFSNELQASLSGYPISGGYQAL